MSTATALSVQVSATINADPATLYDLIGNVENMPRFSPETIHTEWIGGATQPAVGARFKGTNQLKSAKWSTKPTVTVAEPGRRFAFKVPGRSGAEWSYTFEPVAGGTLVTESMQQTGPSPALIRLLQRRNGVTDRATHLRDAMTTTLSRLASAASPS